MSLPEGWAELKDPSSGRTYFYHAETKKSQWTRPEAASRSAAAAAGASGSDGGAVARSCSSTYLRPSFATVPAAPSGVDGTHTATVAR